MRTICVREKRLLSAMRGQQQKEVSVRAKKNTPVSMAISHSPEASAHSRLRKKTKKRDKEDWKGTAAKRREAGRAVPGNSYAIFQSRMRTSTLAAPLYMSMAGL